MGNTEPLTTQDNLQSKSIQDIMKQREELINLCSPISEFLRSNYNHHTRIEISCDDINVVENIQCIKMK